jgi:hypothetical protein
MIKFHEGGCECLTPKEKFSAMACMITSNTYIGKIYMIDKKWFVPYA